MMDGAYEVHEYALFLFEEFWPDYPEALDNPWVLLMIIALLLILPCGLVTRFVDLAPLASIGVLGILVSFACLALALLRQVETFGFDPQNQLVLFGTDLSAALSCAQGYNTVFFFHPFLTFIFRDLRDASIARCMRACWISNSISLMLMYGGGIMSYLLFQEDPDSANSIFAGMNLAQPEAVLGIVASGVTAICTLAYYSAYMARLSTALVLGTEGTNRICNFIGVTASVFGFIFLMFVSDDVSEIVYLIGDLCAIALVFVLPPAFYFVQFKTAISEITVAAAFLMVAGFAFAGVLLYIVLPEW
jgi:hypothetical protein